MLYWALALGFNCISLAAIIILIFPLPFKLRMKEVNFVFSKKKWIFGLIGLYSLLFAQEFTEQSKCVLKRRKATTHETTHFFAIEQFKHQRNMYIAVLGIVLLSITFILSKLLRNFMNEIKLLQEQLAARQASNAQNNTTENEPEHTD